MSEPAVGQFPSAGGIEVGAIEIVAIGTVVRWSTFSEIDLPMEVEEDDVAASGFLSGYDAGQGAVEFPSVVVDETDLEDGCDEDSSLGSEGGDALQELCHSLRGLGGIDTLLPVVVVVSDEQENDVGLGVGNPSSDIVGEIAGLALVGPNRKTGVPFVEEGARAEGTDEFEIIARRRELVVEKLPGLPLRSQAISEGHNPGCGQGCAWQQETGKQ